MEDNALRIGWQRDAIDLPTSNRDQAEDADNPLAALRICLVSENPFACRTIKQILQSVGIWSVAEYRSFDLGGKALGERKFDVIIIDSAETDSEALEFVTQVRGSFDEAVSRLPIVAVMDGADLDRVRDIRDQGVNAILLRPFSPKGLMLRIRKALDRSAAFIRANQYVGPCRRAPRRELKSVGEERRAG